MTKETKVGLVIGLAFIVVVVYLLHWATKPSEFGQPSNYQQEVAYKPDPEPQREPLPSLSVATQPHAPAETMPDTVAETPAPAAAPVFAIPKPPERFYIVKSGQTLSDIARIVYGSQHGDKCTLIREANKHKISNVDMIYPDLKLLIPPLGSAAPIATQPRLTTRTPRTYTVKPGDNLSDISSKTLGTSRRWREIRNLNRDQLPNEDSFLQPGMVLKLPISSAAKLRLPGSPDQLFN